MGEQLSLLIFYLNVWFPEDRPDLPSYNAHCAGSRVVCYTYLLHSRFLSCHAMLLPTMCSLLHLSATQPFFELSRNAPPHIVGRSVA